MSKFDRLKKSELTALLEHIEGGLQDLPDALEWTGYSNEVMLALRDLVPTSIEVIKRSTHHLKVTTAEIEGDRLARVVEQRLVEYFDQEYETHDPEVEVEVVFPAPKEP